MVEVLGRMKKRKEESRIIGYIPPYSKRIKKSGKEYSIFGMIFDILVSVMAGFGVFWYYNIAGWNVWVSISAGLFTSALVSRVLKE